MKREISDQLTIAMNSGGIALTAAFRVVLLCAVAICGLAITGLNVIDRQLSEHK